LPQYLDGLVQDEECRAGLLLQVVVEADGHPVGQQLLHDTLRPEEPMIALKLHSKHEMNRNCDERLRVMIKRYDT